MAGQRSLTLAARTSIPTRSVLAALVALGALALTGCPDNSAPAQAPQPPTYGYPPPQYGYPQQGYGAPPYAPQAPTGYPQQPAPYPTQPAPAQVQVQGGPLPALVGAAAWQGETQAVLAELRTNLSPDRQALVAGIPLVFDPDPTQVNAYAECDDSGNPSIVGTEGLLEAVDAISQTKACDQLFGTRTYDAYTAAITPVLVSAQGGSAMLPGGIVPAQYWSDPNRVTRAHQIFDEMVGFTFGHELSHHYLGHTGCAHGQPAGIPPIISQLGRMLSNTVNVFNQPNEIAADSAGCVNVLDAGKARQARGLYRWTEEGGLFLLDFFARMAGASGNNAAVVEFLSTHPDPGLRIPIVQGVAQTWRLQHPG